MENFEISLLRLLVDVLFGWFLIKYVKSIIGVILESGKVCSEGKIVGLVLGFTYGAPLERYLGWNDDAGAWKEPGKILASSKKSNF